MIVTSDIHPVFLFKSPFEKPDKPDKAGQPNEIIEDKAKNSEPGEEKYIFCRGMNRKRVFIFFSSQR